MPELQCPECRKELLPQRPGNQGDYCICSDCGREVYIRTRSHVKAQCPKCGKENETIIAK